MRKLPGNAMAPHSENDKTQEDVPNLSLKRHLWTTPRRWVESADILFSRLSWHAPDADLSESLPTAVDKRHYPRIHIKNTSVHVTDGCLFATARIDNISSSGICLCNLPEQLYRHAGQLTVYSSDNPRLPVLHIEPRWQQTNWCGKTIGAAILNVSETWRLFLAEASSQSET